MSGAGRYGRQHAQTAELVRQMLLEIAERLETRRPDVPLTAVGRIALIQATTMAPPLASALRAKAPEITGPITRRAYAAKLREAAQPPSQPRARAERVAELHDLCDQDFAAAQSRRERQDRPDFSQIQADQHGNGTAADAIGREVS